MIYDSLLLDYIKESKELNELNNQFIKENKGCSLVKIANAILCNECNTLAFTTHNHDLRYCKCGKSGIDGGIYSTFRTIGNNYTWTPCFIVVDKKFRKKNKVLNEKTSEVRNLVNKINNLLTKNKI